MDNKSIKKRKCRRCKNPYKPRLVNGIVTSVYCSKCLVLINKEKREKAKQKKLESLAKKKERKLNSKKYQKSLYRRTHNKTWKLMREYALHFWRQ